MHKGFYASGFLYSLSTQQILLQQYNNNPFWLLFGGKSQKNEKPIHAFRRIISQQLKGEIPTKKIFAIYDYSNGERGENCHIFYAQIEKEKKFRAKKGYTIEWFTLKQISKLKLSEQTKQDIIVGQRVINAAARDKVESQTKKLLVNKS